MARLVDCFAALFSLGVALRAAIAAGHPAATPAGMRLEARQMLDAGRAAAATTGASPAQIESAAFALVAWLDEIVARHPLAKADDVALQMQLFNSTNAHTEFFHHLAALTADDDAVREVYLQVLMHGFKGQYYFEEDDSGELAKLRQLHSRKLAMPPPGQAPSSALPPPAAAAPRSRGRGSSRANRQWAVPIGVLTFVALLVLSWLAWQWTRGPQESTQTLAQRIEAQLQDYACSDLQLAVGAAGETRIVGFVPTVQDMARVQQEITDMAGAAPPGFDLQLRVWPYCEIVAILKPYQARNRNTTAGLTVSAPSARAGRLREGDAVTIEVTMPQAHGNGHVWVDYYTAEGAVMHLNEGRGQSLLRPGEKLSFGRDIPSSWMVSPPFGPVLVTALSSPFPFAETAGRPPFELASDYLLRLRETLAANKGGERLVAEFIFLETTDR
ncbi:MAG: type IV / vi secretion system, dotu [Variovorax sp.]|nr:MAG: type IV / vi secretion system, dotu [Variovorax sp.]